MSFYQNYVPAVITDFANRYLMVCDAIGYEGHPSFLINRSFFQNNLVMFVLNGCLIVEQYGSIFEVPALHGIVMDLTDPHKYYFSSKTNSEIIWFHFRGEPCQKILSELRRHQQLPLLFQDSSFETQYQSLYQLLSSGNMPDEFEISSTIYRIVNHIFCITDSNCLKTLDDFQTAASRYVLSIIDDKISLSDFAGYMNMSNSHFSRTFRQKFGCSPVAYIMEQKINKAKRMLIYTNASVSAIAYQLSFYDQSYFTKVFHRFVGMTPAEYKKSVEK